MRKKRVMLLFLIFILCISFLIIKVFIIQTVKAEEYLRQASAQRTIFKTLKLQRGEILDKYGIRFTNRASTMRLVLKPRVLKMYPSEIEKIAKIINKPYSELKRRIDFETSPIIFEITDEQKDSIINANIFGVSVVEMYKRYDKKSLAKHVTGYIRDTSYTGQSGLEKYWQDVLYTDGGYYAGVIIDAQRNLIGRKGYRIFKNISDNQLNLKLTLSWRIQKIVEDVMDIYKIKGAVVVEDVYNGDILAMASKPDYNPNSIEKYLKDSSKPLFNRAVAAYMPGSIFKIVSVAAALETGIPVEDEFFCKGKITLGDRDFKCWSFDYGGHGLLNMIEAFSLSCNTFFINMCLKLGTTQLIEIAQKFGLGRRTGIFTQGVEEASGIIPDKSSYFSDGDIANMSIGQGTLLMTPLQAAQLSAIIANGGIRISLNIVDSIVNKNGEKIRDLRNRNWERAISRKTALILQEMMKKTVKDGTGKNAALYGYGGAAGKTGSAETGQIVNGEKIIHAWFTGYFPLDSPRYSMCILVENGKSGGKTAAPIFAEIAARIIESGF